MFVCTNIIYFILFYFFTISLARVCFRELAWMVSHYSLKQYFSACPSLILPCRKWYLRVNYEDRNVNLVDEGKNYSSAFILARELALVFYNFRRCCWFWSYFLLHYYFSSQVGGYHVFPAPSLVKQDKWSKHEGNKTFPKALFHQSFNFHCYQHPLSTTYHGMVSTKKMTKPRRCSKRRGGSSAQYFSESLTWL